MSDVRTQAIPDHRSDHRTAGAVLIYVFGNQDETWLKIGKTRQPAKLRGQQLRGSAPDAKDLVFLAGVWGMDSDERYIHHFFSTHQASSRSREYFHPSDAVRSWVRWLRHQYYVATDADSTLDLERVPSSEWLPNAQRAFGHEHAPQALSLPFNGAAWRDLDLPEITGDDYYTAPKIIDAARAAMGGIDLDPASHPKANQVVRALTFYTFASNGLDKSWAGRVWCNPPFNQWDKWGPKMLSEIRSGRVESCCVLMANRSMSTLDASALIAECDAACQTRGRIAFWGPKAGSPDDGHIILYFGPDRRGFALAFRDIGPVMFATDLPATS